MRVVVANTKPYAVFGNRHKLKRDISVVTLDRFEESTEQGFYINHLFPSSKKELFITLTRSVNDVFERARTFTRDKAEIEYDKCIGVVRIGKHTDMLKITKYTFTHLWFEYTFDVSHDVLKSELCISVSVERVA
jgi:hypothetical protein